MGARTTCIAWGGHPANKNMDVIENIRDDGGVASLVPCSGFYQRWMGRGEIRHCVHSCDGFELDHAFSHITGSVYMKEHIAHDPGTLMFQQRTASG